MPKYIFAYHGGEMPSTPEEGAKIMKMWGDWIAGVGPKMINPGNPAGKSWTVGESGVVDNGGANPIYGYSIVETDTIEQAIEIAQTCPQLSGGGTVEVAALLDM